MRVVTTRTRHLTAATDITTAPFHLLELRNRFLSLGEIRRSNEETDNVREGYPRAIIVKRTTEVRNAIFANQMALPANVFLQLDVEVFRIDDARIPANGRIVGQPF